MEVHCKPSNVRHVTRIATAPAQHNIPSMAQRTTQATPTRYCFSFNELYHVLYLQREVEVVKVENIKPQIVAANSPEKKPPVAKNKDSLVKCEMCRGQPQGECTEHGPLFFPRKTKSSSLDGIRLSYAISSFPDEVQLCWSSIPVAGYGVSAKQHIPIGTWIGPYEGRRMRPEDVTAEMDTSYMWEIFQDGKLVCYLDASDENTSSWMRFIRCARHRDEQNLYAFQYCGNIYYRAFRNISVGQELLVWYDEKYQHHMGLPLDIQDMAVVDPNGNNLLYDLMACNIKPPISEQPQGPVTQSTPVTKQSHGKVLAHASAALLFHQQEPPRPAQPSPAMAQQVTTVAPRRALPVTQSPTVTQHPAVSHPVFVSVTPKYPIPAPINTSVSGAVTEPSSVEVTQRSPIPVTQPSSVTIETRPTPQANKVQSTERKKLLHDRLVSPLMEMKHLQAIHGTHARQRIMNGETAVLPHGQDIAFSDLQRSVNAITEVNGLAEDQLELLEDSESSMWKCGQCQRSFTQRALLQIHVCPGMANRPYKCGHCADSFSLSNELRTHVVKHTNEKPFKCGYCSRSFAGATTLNNHIRTHTGEKPFICRKCRKTFSTASHLSRHQRIPSECI